LKKKLLYIYKIHFRDFDNKYIELTYGTTKMQNVILHTKCLCVLRINFYSHAKRKVCSMAQNWYEKRLR